MKTKKSFILASAIILVLVLSGCGPSGGLPTCATSALVAPVLVGPAMWEIDPLLPTLSWSYPDATCKPEGYAIELKEGPFFTDNYGGGTGNPSTTWTPGYPLALGEEWAWGVRAINGTTLGPFAGYRYFFTGPVCETAALQSPNLLQPANGSVITDLDPTLIWRYPLACLPQGYRVDLSVDSTFADTSLSGGTGNPSTRWGPGHPLADCTVYFWKVAPINDTTLGPASGMFSFTTNVTGACPTVTPVGPTPTPLSPTFTPTAADPTFTPTPVAGLTFTPNLNAYCRLGPGPLYSSIGLAMNGMPYLLDGRNPDNSWFRIMLTAFEGCWVPAQSGLPSGDTLNLRVLLIPTLIPSDIPTQVVNCAAFTDSKTCDAQPACKWITAVTHAGDCVNK